MGRLLVFSGPASPDREAEYNEWYDNVHLKEVCALEPFTGAQRFKASEAQIMGQPDAPYLAIYEFTGPAQGAIDALMAGFASFNMTDAMDSGSSKIIVMDEHGERYQA